MKIEKSKGQTRTEKLLGDLCDDTFLKLWSYLNPFKEDGKELCDLLVVFENHIFIFFDREKYDIFESDKDIEILWKRWKREVVDKQIKTALGAERYIKSQNKIYLDAKNEQKFPHVLPEEDVQIHKIIIAHGAHKACKKESKNNLSGSLAISYNSEGIFPFTSPFLVQLDQGECVHIFDSENLEIIFQELDTFYDFKSYLLAKEEAIKRHAFLMYCGEEDLLANYFLNFNEKENRHFIGIADEVADVLVIDEGGWGTFKNSDAYKRKKEADSSSYLWDELIQRTSKNALEGTLLGDAIIFEGKSAIHEMAKEPRFFRRVLSDKIRESINKFPEKATAIMQQVTFLPSFCKETGYVFLQLKCDDKGDYEKDYRPKRAAILEIACGVVKNRLSYLNKVVGIAIDAPKFSDTNSEDLLLMYCYEWSPEQKEHYEKVNIGFNFFSNAANIQKICMAEFPQKDD